jgi:hypothetical protein
VLGDEASLLRSDIYLGLAEANAQCKEEKDALSYIDLAYKHFPAFPQHDPSFIYADCSWNVLYQWQGRTYLELAKHYPERGYQQKASDAITQSVEAQSISERCTNEIIVCLADAARMIGELDLFTGRVREGALMAITIGSKKRYDEAYESYQQTPEQWKYESQIRSLAEDIFAQVLPGKMKHLHG